MEKEVIINSASTEYIALANLFMNAEKSGRPSLSFKNNVSEVSVVVDGVKYRINQPKKKDGTPGNIRLNFLPSTKRTTEDGAVIGGAEFFTSIKAS